MYYDKILPFLKDSDFVKNHYETISLKDIYCPLEGVNVLDGEEAVIENPTGKEFKVFKVLPSNVYVLNERDSVCVDIMSGKYGQNLRVKVTELDYMTVAKRIEVLGDKARIATNGSHNIVEGILTSEFVNSASKGVRVNLQALQNLVIPQPKTFSLETLMEQDITEGGSVGDLLSELRSNRKSGNGRLRVENTANSDYIYKWLDSYFALPEAEEMKSGGREVVPLLIGPTGVFKSATIKELCKKYDYRLVDFRVSFTCRLDYSGLFQTKEIDNQMYSFNCPMEEIVTCSDGFREYCKQAKEKLEGILADGFFTKRSGSSGNGVTETQVELNADQRALIESTIAQYKEYCKTPVLFFDEITRTQDAGVEGILVQLLNQKRFNGMTLYGCKFVSATNLNLEYPGDDNHNQHKRALDDMYDVNTDLDIAYANRFFPLKVYPKDVKGRWFDWAKGTKEKNGKMIQNIHPLILEFLDTPQANMTDIGMVYDDTPILNAIDDGRSEEERKSQTFPNYRTWEMCSDYIFSIDEEASREGTTPTYRDTIINGLISDYAGEPFMEFLEGKGYRKHTDLHGEPNDDVGDFLDATLSAGVPALMIGPSSLGKTARVKAYMKKVEKRTGLAPVLIDVNLASMDTSELMGFPVKKSLKEYVTGTGLESVGLGSISKELNVLVSNIRKDKAELGLVDSLTIRAPGGYIKEQFKRALDEGREVILFFDECNRVTNPTVMSAMFECISDYRFAGISFKDQKDRVKIVSACNMGSSEMGERATKAVGSYDHAGAIDPALAARFSIYWKKNYDEKDARSFIDFLESEKEDGIIDGTVLEYLKTKSDSELVDIIASVESRTIENAEPSTRALNQLSKEIKNNRTNKNSELFRGKLFFNQAFRDEYSQTEKAVINSYMSITEKANICINFMSKIVAEGATWEPAIIGKAQYVGMSSFSASELIDRMRTIIQNMKEILLRPLTSDTTEELEDYIELLFVLADACHRLDAEAQEDRKKVLEAYVGEDFVNDGFFEYFNLVFGTQNDVEITIEMLEDESLIDTFMDRFSAMNLSQLGPDQKVSKCLELIREFWDVHADRLPALNYAMFIRGIQRVLPTAESMQNVLSHATEIEDNVFAMAEGVGDNFIMEMLKTYPATFSDKDIADMRASMSKKTNNTKRKSRIL